MFHLQSQGFPTVLGARRRPFTVKHGFTHFMGERRDRTLLTPIFQTAVFPISESADFKVALHFWNMQLFLLDVGNGAFGFGRERFLKTPQPKLD